MGFYCIEILVCFSFASNKQMEGYKYHFSDVLREISSNVSLIFILYNKF